MNGIALTLVVTGAPLARHSVSLASALVDAGWDVDLTLSSASGAWIQPADFKPLGLGLRQHGGGRPRPSYVVACPLTFNSANKLALGVSDEAHLGVLNDAVGAKAAVVAVPFVSDRLWGHPQWQLTLERLSAVGVTLVDPLGRADGPGPVPSGTGDEVADAFDPGWVVDALRRLG